MGCQQPQTLKVGRFHAIAIRSVAGDKSISASIGIESLKNSYGLFKFAEMKSPNFGFAPADCGGGIRSVSDSVVADNPALRGDACRFS